MTKRFFRVYQGILLAVLIAILIPMVIAGFYNRPASDDLFIPYPAMNALQSGGSFGDALKAAAEDTVKIYFGVNGAFASIFINHLPPMIFNYKLAWLHPIFFLLMLVIVCLRFAQCIRVYYPDTPKAVAGCSGLLLCVMFLMLMRYPSETIYWFVGAMAYTFSFQVATLVACDLAIAFKRCGLKGRGGAVHLALLCLACVYLGGSNLVTPTVAVVLYGFFVFWLFIRKQDKRFALPFVFLILGYLVGVLAPGNFARQSGAGEPYPMVLAFIQSFITAFHISFADVDFWLFTLLFAPMAAVISRYTRFQYKYFYLPPLGCLCMLAAAVFPEILSLRMLHMARMADMRLYMRCFMAFILMVYYAGFIRKLVSERFPGTHPAAPPTSRRRLPAILTATVAVMFLLVSVPDIRLSPLTFSCELTPVRMVSAFRDGRIQRYAAEYDKLVDIARSHPGEDVVTSLNPKIFCFMDAAFEQDIYATPNYMFAQYFGCRSIYFDPEAPDGLD